jgi:hypothetical protein
MATNTPNSYKDPYWTDLATATEAKLGLPDGLLAAIVTKGERSNHDQVSEAGARTVFQIIPATRKAAIDKYGIDPYLNPENAAEVAGLLLKDSLDRNKGNVQAAVAEYHGGTVRANWGPRTRAYAARVVGDQQQIAQGGQPAGGSTFQRVMAANPQYQQNSGPSSSQINQVYQAYKAGKMTPDEAGQFEADVKSGLVMLPKGAALNGQQTQSPTEKPAAVMLPKAISDAYVQGKLSEQERNDLEADMKAGLVKLPVQTTSLIPTDDPNWQPPTEQGIIQRPKEPTLGERLVGAGERLVGAHEAELTMLTGMTGGTVGMVGGTLKQMIQNVLDGTFGTQQAADLVEKAAMEGAQLLTYAPRTEQGREQAQAVGDFLQQTIPVTPLTAEMGMLGATMRNAAPAVKAATVAKAAPVVEAVAAKAAPALEQVKAVAGKMKQAVTGTPERPTPGTGGSVGVAGADMATLRQGKAEELPVPIELTKGQRERTFEQQQFEREVAKNPEVGAPIRERFADQNDAIYKNFDAFIDMTGAETADLRSVGTAVDQAIRARAARDKTKIRTLYKEAEKAGELEQPVTLDSVVQHINDNWPDVATAPLLKTAKDWAIKLGIATEDANGNLVAAPVTLKRAETFRQAINRNTDMEPTNIRQASILKGAVDQATDGLGGNLYKQARAARAKYAADYENVGLIKDLVGMKRTSADRVVALENVFDRSIKNGSLDDVRQLRRILQTEGDSGQQAWKELQGATIRHIQEQAFGGASRDTRGNPIVSAPALERAVAQLDRSGKLDFIFGKKGAEQIRLINDVAKDVATAPPGAVNTSNTASALLTALDTVASYGTTGLPVPVAHLLKASITTMKNRKLKARVQAALNSKGAK